MVLEIVGLSISLPALLPKLVQGIRTSIIICRAHKEIPGLLHDFSALIEDAEERNNCFQSQNSKLPPVKNEYLQNSKKLGEIIASKDKIHGEMNAKQVKFPNTFLLSCNQAETLPNEE